MTQSFDRKMSSWGISYHRLSLFFIPLIVAGGRLVCRVIMNFWNMIER